MTLQAILDKIRAAGDVQIQEVENDARSQAGEILAQARMDAEQVRSDAIARVSLPAIAEHARIVHHARLDALHVVGNVRENLVDEAITQTREHLASFRSDPAYPRILRRLTEEALAQLAASEGGGKFQLLIDPRDKALIQDILKDLGLDIPVRHELNCWGGLVAQSEDGRVVVINTLESRLEQAGTFLRHHLAAYFEEEQFEMEEVRSPCAV